MPTGVLLENGHHITIVWFRDSRASPVTDGAWAALPPSGAAECLARKRLA